MVADDKVAMQLPKNLELYLDENGNCPFQKWRRDQRGDRGVAIDQALDRVRDGKTVKVKRYGSGISAIILSWPTKLRIYYGLSGLKTIVLLGGDEHSQSKDLNRTKLYWDNFQSRGNTDG